MNLAATAAPWIIVPYKEQVGVDRILQLHELINKLDRYFAKYGDGMVVNVLAVKQVDSLPWNAGALINAGVYAINGPCTHVINHATDTYPIAVNYGRLLGMSLLTPKKVNGVYYSSVVSFNYDAFMVVNGYSNQYWGWGSEDADILLRFQQRGFAIGVQTQNKFRELPTNDAAFVLHRDAAVRNHDIFLKAWNTSMGKSAGTTDGIFDLKPATIVDKFDRQSMTVQLAEIDLSTVLVYCL